MDLIISLHGRLAESQNAEPFVARITTNPNLHKSLRSTEALLLDDGILPDDHAGFKAVLALAGSQRHLNVLRLPPELSYLTDGDVVRANPKASHIRVLYRKSSRFNGLFVTERCNSKCLMCSQPPRDVDDGYLVGDLLEAIPLMSRETPAIGFTGGEITLLHEGFISLVTATKNYLPETKVDVLTNGRLLSYLPYAERVGAIKHPNLTLCIPLYADVDSLHDFVVQASGAFDQTLRGIMNLARVGVAVEIRVVLHRITIPRLAALAEFIRMNLPFVRHVALMGLEMTGFTKANLAALWIDPFDYQHQLTDAVETLDSAGLNVSIYNHQLCVLPQCIWPFARKSISDWKNIYYPECEACGVKERCGGFFASSTLRRSDHIRPLLPTALTP